MRRAWGAFLLLALLPACGKKGDPLPPLRPTPAAVAGLRVAQRGNQVEITFTAPRASTDGARLPVLDLELFVAEGEGDFLKSARSRRFKGAPGEAFTETEPLPAPGTHLRVGARALSRGHRGNLGEPRHLVVTAPLAAPGDLAAQAAAEGVSLSWRGEVPAPLPTPTPKPTSAPNASPEPNPPEGVPSPPGSPTAVAPAPGPPPGPPPSPIAGTLETPVPAALPAESGPAAAAPKPKPTPTPFAPGFFIYRRTAETRYAAPLQPRAVALTTFVDAAKIGESWCYVVRAVASAEPLVESAPSNEACVLVKDIVAPAPPAGLTAVAEEDGIEVRWSSSPDSDVVAYRVYRTSRRAEPEVIAEVKAPATSYLDQDATAGGRLRYRVSALDGAGNESAPTPPVDVIRP